MIKKEAEIFGLLFLGDGATISRCLFLNILDFSKNIPVDVLEIRLMVDSVAADDLFCRLVMYALIFLE